MNFVSWDRLVSLYPREAFRPLERLEFCRWNQGYSRRVSSIRLSLSNSGLDEIPFPSVGHWVGDRTTWSVKLRTANIRPPKSVFRWDSELNSWVLRETNSYSYSYTGFAVNRSKAFEVIGETPASPKLSRNSWATSGFLAFLEPQPTLRVRIDNEQFIVPPSIVPVKPHLQRLTELVKVRSQLSITLFNR